LSTTIVPLRTARGARRFEVELPRREKPDIHTSETLRRQLVYAEVLTSSQFLLGSLELD